MRKSAPLAAAAPVAPRVFALRNAAQAADTTKIVLVAGRPEPRPGRP